MMHKSIINVLLFQTGWFSCVLGAAYDQPFYGSLLAILIIVWHILRSPQGTREFILVLAALFIGLVWDSYLVSTGWIKYHTGMLHPYLAPYWIVIMWGLFATTLNVSLSWLTERPWLQIVFGMTGGPLAYYTGSLYGALEFNNSTAALSALAIGWGILTPLLFYISHELSHTLTPRQRQV